MLQAFFHLCIVPPKCMKQHHRTEPTHVGAIPKSTTCIQSGRMKSKRKPGIFQMKLTNMFVVNNIFTKSAWLSTVLLHMAFKLKS